MLKQRFFTSLLLFIIIISIFNYTTDYLFASIIWLGVLMASHELTKMYKFSLIQEILLLSLNTGIALCTYYVSYDISFIMRMIMIITWCFVVPIILILKIPNFNKSIIAIFSICLFIPAFYSLVVLRSLFGTWQLISILMVAWIADTSAFFVGRSYGKFKLAPSISPGKSIEGAIGGMVAVILYLLILKKYNLVNYLSSYYSAIKFALILTTVSIIGDLFESWLKRVAKVKDSGSLLPGHGGLLDRIDSLIAVVAIAFAMIRGMI